MGEIIKKDNRPQKSNADSLPALMREVEEKIVVVRGQKTLLDRDVAELYGVETREVNQAVRNNPSKFRDGYVIELNSEESAVLRSTRLTLEPSKGKGRYSNTILRLSRPRDCTCLPLS